MCCSVINPCGYWTLGTLSALVSNRNTLYNVMGVKRHIITIDLPQSVSISGAEINLTVRAVSTGVLCCDLARFLLWIGTYCISRVTEQRTRVKDVSSLVGYDDSCLAAIRHVKSIIRVVQPRPIIRSHSVLFSLWRGNIANHYVEDAFGDHTTHSPLYFNVRTGLPFSLVYSFVSNFIQLLHTCCGVQLTSKLSSHAKQLVMFKRSICSLSLRA